MPKPPARPASKRPDPRLVDPRPVRHELPQHKVLLHNDDTNEFGHVVKALRHVANLELEAATKVATEAEKQKVALVCVTHKERAELLRDQFKSYSLTVTIEPA